MTFTHDQLVKRAKHWLANTMGCRLVLSELHAPRIREVPDAMGWNARSSILIECKTNRADFHADKNKTFRARPRYGMGEYRYYLAPPGVITAEDLPKNWGLLVVYPKLIRVLVNPVRYDLSLLSLKYERAILESACYRLLYSCKLLKPVCIYDRPERIMRRGKHGEEA